MSSFLSSLDGKSLSFLEGILQCTLHIECCFGIVVSFSFQKSSEAIDSVLQQHQLTFSAGEDLTHEERLRQEFLNLSSSGHSQFIVF